MSKRVDAAQAGAFVGAVFGTVSLLLCGDVAPLALNTSEEQEIGAALSACLATLPTPLGETVGLLGPWSKLATTLGGAILKRMAMIAAAKATARATAAPTQGPRAAAQSVPYAPPPTPPPTNGSVPPTTGLGEVFAPMPQI